jgi:hypothetical protein
MAQAIPDTDSVIVALIAATLSLVESSEFYSSQKIERRCQSFVEVYEVLSTLVQEGAEGARTILEASKSS